MNRLALIVLILLVGAGSAWAQVARVRITTGEHADFTRLVAQTGQDLRWRLIQGPRSARLEFSDADARFALEGAFARIPRTRLSDLRAGPDGLSLILDCDCPITSFELRPGIIVIDIANPSVPLPAPLPPIVLTADPLQGLGAGMMADRQAASAPIRVETPPYRRLSTSPDPLSVATGVGASLARAQRLERERIESGAVGRAIEGVAASPLMQQVAAAVSQGLLEAAVDTPRAQSPRAPSQVLAPTDFPPDAALDPLAPFLTISDATQDRPEPEPTEAAFCALEPLAARIIEPSSDGGQSPLGTGFDTLYGEFDVINDAAADTLVVALLSHGLGAEARVAIDMSPRPEMEGTLLRAIADVVDDRMTNARAALAEHHACGGAIGLFARMARWPDHIDEDEATRLAIAFAQMPHALRRTLGETLIDHFIAAGTPDAARIGLDGLIRAGFLTTSQLAPIEAAVEAMRGNLASAHRLATRHAPANAAQTRLQHETALAIGAATDAQSLEHAEAIATSERGTPAGRLLMEDVIRASIELGDFSNAFARFDRLGTWLSHSSDDAARHVALQDALWQAFIRDADDLSFVETLITRNDWRAQRLGPATIDALRARMQALRFGNETLDLLAPPEQGEADQLRGSAASGVPTASLLANVRTEASPDATPPGPTQDPVQSAAQRGIDAATQADRVNPNELDAALSPTPATQAPVETDTGTPATAERTARVAEPDGQVAPANATQPIPPSIFGSLPSNAMEQGLSALAQSERLRQHLSALLPERP